MTASYLPFDEETKPAWDAFLEVTRHELAAVLPARLSPTDSLVVTEALEVIYAIMPHDSLGGFSLVGAMTDGQASLFWTAIRTLTYHDDLDLAWGRYTVWDSVHSAGVEFISALRAELVRPIRAYARLQRGRVIRLTCELLGGFGNDKPQVVFRHMRSPFDGPVTEHAFETSLSDPTTPPLQCSPGVEAWFD